MSYRIGTLLHGNNTKIGNIWIVDVDNSFRASLLWDGKLKLYIQDHMIGKQDTMSLGMIRATYVDILNAYGPLPNWAISLFLLAGSSSTTAMSTPPPNINNAALHSIINSLGLEEKKVDTGRESDSMWSVSKDACRHEYKDYFGFTENYQYCMKCDHKVRMER